MRWGKKKKTDEQIHKQGFVEGQAQKEREMNATFNIKKQDLINYYEEEIDGLKFEIERIGIKLQATQAENDKMQVEAVEAKKRLSEARKIEKRWDSIQNDFREALQQEEKIRMEPLWKINKLIDNLEIKQLEG